MSEEKQYTKIDDGETSRSSEESSSQEQINLNNSTTKESEIHSNNTTSELLTPPASLSSTSFTSGASTSRTTDHLQTNLSNNPSETTDEMKRTIAKKLIERYFYQLSEGCGNPKCSNKNCASSGDVEILTPNQAAARAIQLYIQEAQLCEIYQSKIPRMECDNDNEENNVSNMDSPRATTSSSTDNELPSSSKYLSTTSPATASSSSRLTNYLQNTSKYSVASNFIDNQHLSYVNEDILEKLIAESKANNTDSQLKRYLGKIFSTKELIGKSFQKISSKHVDEMLEKAPKNLKDLKKEDFRTLEGDMDKDEDSSTSSSGNEIVPKPNYTTTLDLPSLRRIMSKLYEFNSTVYYIINNAIHSLSVSLSADLRFRGHHDEIEEMLPIFVILYEIIIIAPSEFIEESFPAICKTTTNLPVWAQARLAKIWAENAKTSLTVLLQTLQQLISLHVIAGSWGDYKSIHDSEIIVAATKVMKIVFYASLLAGTVDSPSLRETEADEDQNQVLSVINEEESLFGYESKQATSTIVEDELAVELKINVLDCRKPYIPFEEFYNEPLSDAIKMENDYLNYKSRKLDSNKFCFMFCAFILTPQTKAMALFFDSRIRMYSERRISMFHTHMDGQPANPYLKIKVRRDHIIDDALVELEMIAMGNPKDFKKQLVVEFIGEQGIDEGGVSKEFFQLVVEQIFNPDYGMFIQQEDTNTVWFSSTSFETEAQFTLIGIVLGLAIYNNIILAMNFPMVVYRKLLGMKGSFDDLKDFKPTLHNSMMSMLNHEESDMEEVFMQTFEINYTDVFGNVLTHKLKPDAENIFVNQGNKQEFVDLYADYLLNLSIEKQFKAFKRGFQMVTDESPLQLLFRPEEIELLICGSKQFDFVELEKSTDYEAGFTHKSQTIIDFWSIVHELPLESKKKLLEFTTGSDRVPVGGLRRLKLVIARNGSDSDRLPTSHTCFNVLLLPEYSTKEKLKDRLLKAINYSKGFGML